MVATTMQKYRHAYEEVSISCEESNSSLLLDKVAERQRREAASTLCGSAVWKQTTMKEGYLELPWGDLVEPGPGWVRRF